MHKCNSTYKASLNSFLCFLCLSISLTNSLLLILLLNPQHNQWWPYLTCTYINLGMAAAAPASYHHRIFDIMSAKSWCRFLTDDLFCALYLLSYLYLLEVFSILYPFSSTFLLSLSLSTLPSSSQFPYHFLNYMWFLCILRQRGCIPILRCL